MFANSFLDPFICFLSIRHAYAKRIKTRRFVLFYADNFKVMDGNFGSMEEALEECRRQSIRVGLVVEFNCPESMSPVKRVQYPQRIIPQAKSTTSSMTEFNFVLDTGKTLIKVPQMVLDPGVPNIVVFREELLMWNEEDCLVGLSLTTDGHLQYMPAFQMAVERVGIESLSMRKHKSVYIPITAESLANSLFPSLLSRRIQLRPDKHDFSLEQANLLEWLVTLVGQSMNFLVWMVNPTDENMNDRLFADLEAAGLPVWANSDYNGSIGKCHLDHLSISISKGRTEVTDILSHKTVVHNRDYYVQPKAK